MFSIFDHTLFHANLLIYLQYRTVPDMYADVLVNEGVMTKEEVDCIVSEHSQWLNNMLKSMDTYIPQVTNKYLRHWNLLDGGINCVLLLDKLAIITKFFKLICL
jgi:hypothetical protein